MTQMPSREVTPSGMSLTDATRVCGEIRAAGFHADDPQIAQIRDGSPLYEVQFEGNAGWDVIFTVDAWTTHPANPNRQEPPNW